MTKKSRSHWLHVRVSFDKPTSRVEAKRMAIECFRGENQYPSSYDDSMPAEMWLKGFRTTPPNTRST